MNASNASKRDASQLLRVKLRLRVRVRVRVRDRQGNQSLILIQPE